MKCIIDTNVAIAANGRDTHASEECQLNCIEKLLNVVQDKNHTIHLDTHDLIFDEYTKHLLYRGQPGVGDMFFKHLHDHKYTETLIKLVAISPNQDDETGFDELPANSVDKSDRKFLATAVVSGARIINALDSDWNEQAALLAQLGVHVDQLCPEHGCTLPPLNAPRRTN